MTLLFRIFHGVLLHMVLVNPPKRAGLSLIYFFFSLGRTFDREAFLYFQPYLSLPVLNGRVKAYFARQDAPDDLSSFLLCSKRLWISSRFFRTISQGAVPEDLTMPPSAPRLRTGGSFPVDHFFFVIVRPQTRPFL